MKSKAHYLMSLLFYTNLDALVRVDTDERAGAAESMSLPCQTSCHRIDANSQPLEANHGYPAILLAGQMCLLCPAHFSGSSLSVWPNLAAGLKRVLSLIGHRYCYVVAALPWPEICACKSILFGVVYFSVHCSPPHYT